MQHELRVAFGVMASEMDNRSKTISEPETGVVCTNCGHVNAAGRVACSGCGAGLWKWCPYCDHRNRRDSARCSLCGALLGPSFLERWRERLFPRWSRVRPVHLALVILLAALAYSTTKIMKLANSRAGGNSATLTQP